MNCIISRLRPQKGISLIIVIFSMMLLAVLGLTMAMIITGDFEMNTRGLESEQAFSLADAGIQEALTRLQGNTTLFDTDAKWLNRKLGAGEYNVTRLTNGTRVTMVSSGYVPNQQSRRAMRQVSLTVNMDSLGGYSGVIKNLFDWSAVHSGSTVEGNLTVVDRPDSNEDGYEGNGNFVHNEPADFNVPGTGTRDTAPTDTGFPKINMPWYYSRAGIEGRRWVPAPTLRVARITAVSLRSATRLRVTVTPSIFPNPAPGPSGENFWQDEVIVRNQRGDTGSLAQKWAYQNWGVITSRRSSSQVDIDFDSTADIGANIWQVNEYITIGKYFSYDHTSERIWYIVGDAMFDCRENNLDFDRTSVVAEGDLVIRGSGDIFMRAYRTTQIGRETYPNLGTQNGNIYSPEPDASEPGSETSKRNSRDFDGLIYSENGSVFFNYINGLAITASNVTLDGLIRLRYDGRYIEENSGFVGGVAVFNWREN